mgnify:CR=1 FL=1
MKTAQEQLRITKENLRLQQDIYQTVKEKYDNGTEILKNQLASFPKNIEDDSELKDFDDIVIDDSANGAGEQDASDLDNAEKSEEGEEKPEEPSTPTSPDQE